MPLFCNGHGDDAYSEPDVVVSSAACKLERPEGRTTPRSDSSRGQLDVASHPDCHSRNGPALANTPDTTAALNRITPSAYAILSSAHRIAPMKRPNA